MAFVEINGIDRTNVIDFPNAQYQESSSDPLGSFNFDLEDIGSQIPLKFGDLITVWDETLPTTVIGVPSRNYITNQLISAGSPTTPGAPWIQVGPLTGLQAFQIDSVNHYEMSMTFSNTTFSGGNNYGSIQCNNGNSFFCQIHPGVTYNASVTVLGQGTIRNITAFVVIQFLDGALNNIGSNFSSGITPSTSSAQKVSVQATAPAGTVYAQVSIGGSTSVSGNNSGKIVFCPQDHATWGSAAVSTACVCLEPVLFQGQYLTDGTPINYPTPDCSFLSIDSALLPDGSTTRARWLFNGYIKHLKWSYEETTRTYEIECAPMGDIIDNGPLINQNFSATTDQNIIQTIVSANFSGLLSTGEVTFFAPNTTVQLGQAISSVAYGDCSFRDVMNSLTDSTGFIYYVDQYNYVWYNDTPFNYSQYTINVENPDYISAFPPQNYVGESDGTQLRNSVKVLGGQYFTTSTDVFNGDGATKTFTLTAVPSNLTNVTIGGSTYAPTSSNKIGVKGQDTNGSGGVVVLYDRNSQTVTFNSAPASGSSNVLITYSAYRNVSVLIEDNASIGLYGGRRWYNKVTDTTIADSATAQTRGISEVGAYAYPMTILTFDLTNVYISRGTTVLVTSALDSFSNQPFVVQQVSMKAQGGGVNTFSYTVGQYRPSMVDAMRNTAKALQANTATGGSTVIQLTVESLEETMASSDSITSTTAAGVTAKYGTAIYGMAAYS
jgi:hypothetical protein